MQPDLTTACRQTSIAEPIPGSALVVTRTRQCESSRAQPPRAASTLRWLMLIAVVAIAGCATPIGVTRITPQEASRERLANVLTTGKPSDASTQFIYRLDLLDRAKEDPVGVLKELHAGLGQRDEEDRLLALAELSFFYATKGGDRSNYLAAAAYAWAFLFPEDRTRQLDRYDPRVQLALGLYDRGITEGLSRLDGDNEKLDLSARSIELPFATLQIEADPSRFQFGGYKLTAFTSLADFNVRGLRNRYRQRGIGAALAATVAPTGNSRANKWIPRQSKVPVTALLRFDHPRQGMTNRLLKATLELFDADGYPVTEIAGNTVPLETDNSAALAYRLEGADVWDFEIAGFRRGDFGSFLKDRETDNDFGLFMLHPYRPGRIPIVLVHGTASSPARWAELANEIMGDRVLAGRYQIWFFIYTTGNPIPYSAMLLREGLQAAVNDVDPDGRDAALQKMVVIGHSQGGLLAKMTMVDSGSRFWDDISKTPFEEADLKPETRDLLRRALFVKPLPFVKRGIFIATPQRGSFLADSFFGNLGRKLVSLPGNILRPLTELGELQGPDALQTKRLPTSVDNMSSSNPFLKTLASLPFAPHVYANSIIAVKGNGPIETGDDGVVKYQSAHIEGVESELVVRSGHSTQGTAATIEEVRRILDLHLSEN